MARDLSRDETACRLKRFREVMDKRHPDWDTAVFVGKINQYYFTGTMQDALLVVRRDGAWYFVRRSYERAMDESPLEEIYPMRSYADAAALIGADCGNTYIEAEIMTAAMLERLKKHFRAGKIGSLDRAVLALRAVKTPYELELIEESGRRHDDLLTNVVPSLLREDMSEVDLAAELMEKMLKHGHHGVTRFQMFQTDMGIGQLGFGTSSLYPSFFDGPGGNLGICAAVPIIGSRERKLKKGDLVFVDIGYGVKGYHSDKSQVYFFGGKPPAEALSAHSGCIDVQRRVADLLRPGAIPSEIYRSVIGSLSADFMRNFMGFGSRRVKFLGHGIGLNVDEYPVIAEGFDEPIEENMVFAVEPKKGVEGVGLVGVEDTYVVTSGGARCVTGGGRDIIEV